MLSGARDNQLIHRQAAAYGGMIALVHRSTIRRVLQAGFVRRHFFSRFSFNYFAVSLSCRIWLTWTGLALPRDSFITCPTKNANTLSPPARYCSTCLGLAAMTASTIFSIAPVSVTCLRPFAAIISSAVPSPSSMASNTVLAIFDEMVLSIMRLTRFARALLLIGHLLISISALFR